MSKIYCRTKNKQGDVNLQGFQFGTLQENLAFVKDQRFARKEVEMVLNEECILPVLVVVQ